MYKDLFAFEDHTWCSGVTAGSELKNQSWWTCGNAGDRTLAHVQRFPILVFSVHYLSDPGKEATEKERLPSQLCTQGGSVPQCQPYLQSYTSLITADVQAALSTVTLYLVFSQAYSSN